MGRSKYETIISKDDAVVNRNKVIELLENTHREGVEKVIAAMDEKGFFTAAAAGTRHDCVYGGLAYHSLLVFDEAKRIWQEELKINTSRKDEISEDSLVIAALLHDLCKVDVHPCKFGEEPKRVSGINRNYHGKKSVDMLTKIGFRLTEEESLAIRWHMSRFTEKENFLPGETLDSCDEYAKKYSLVSLIIGADSSASKISSGESSCYHSLDDVIAWINSHPDEKRKMVRILDKSEKGNYDPKKIYKGLIFDIGYFEDKSAADLKELKEYVMVHDVKVGIVTTELKPVYTKWMKKAPINVDHVVGGGDIKIRRLVFSKKPESKPMLMCAAWLDLGVDEILSVCTTNIDKEASEKAKLDAIINPLPKDLIPLLNRKLAEKKSLEMNAVPVNGIFGAVCGDVIGSTYENQGRRTKDYDFEMFTKHSQVSDDSILTMAIAKWLMGDRTDEALARQLIRFARRHPNAWWGSGFKTWLESEDHAPREASSNGSAMRVSPVGYVAASLEECLDLAKQSAQLTHNTPEGIAGAQAIAASVFLTRQGRGKAEVKAYIEKQFGYNFDLTVEQMRATYDLKERFSCACNKCAAEAITCWLLADDYEQCIRYSVSLGGDADTIAAMAGSIAAVTPGMEIPAEIGAKCYEKLPEDLRETLAEFETYCRGNDN